MLLLLGLAILCLVSPVIAVNPPENPAGSIGSVIWNYVWDKFFDWTLANNFSAYNPPDPVQGITCNETDILWRRPDGSCNNLGHPGWGMINSILRRLGNVSYIDGAGEPPEVYAREVSNKIFGSLPQSVSSHPLSLLEFAMGQFFLHDLVLINMNYSEPMSIAFPPNDPSQGNMPFIPFWRSEYVEGTGTNSSNPRQFRNSVPQWIDLNTVYGSSDAAASLLRANDGTGHLRMTPDGLHLPTATPADLEIIPMQVGFDSSMPSAKTIYLAGDIRANQNYMLLAFHTLFAREHNRRCDELRAANSSLDEEYLYQKSKQLTIAVWQSLLIHEFSDSLAGFHGAAEDFAAYLASSLESHYLSDMNPMAHVAWDILYRLHPTLTDLILCNDTFCKEPVGSVTLTEMYFNAVGFNALNVDNVFLGLANTPASTIAPSISERLRNVAVSVKGIQSTVFDLAAYDMQRMADLGVGSLNDVRAIFDLDPVVEWSDITDDQDTLAVLQSVYSSPADVAAFPGVMAEQAVDEVFWSSAFGPSIQRAIGFQALVYSFSDRFFYLRPGWLTQAELAEIANTKLSDIILRNTNISCMPTDATYYHWNSYTSGPNC